MRSSDFVATVTGEEAAEVVRFVPDAHTIVLPTVHDLPVTAPPPFDGRAGMLFIGGFMHDPNVDAMTWFVRDIMPMLGCPGSHLVILGSHPTSEVAALGSSPVRSRGMSRMWSRSFTPQPFSSRLSDMGLA